MSEILDPVDTEATAGVLDIVDLGDAVAETKEAAMLPIWVDSSFMMGWGGG